MIVYTLFGMLMAYVVLSTHMMESENEKVKKVGTRMFYGIFIAPIIFLSIILFIFMYGIYGFGEMTDSFVKMSPVLILVILSMMGAPKFVSYLERRNEAS